jgi:hypothetical protein
MRRPTVPRLTLLAIGAVAVGMSLGFGSADGNHGPAARADATLAPTAYGQGSLAAVVQSETDRGGSVWARRNVAPAGSLLLVSTVASGLALDFSGQARRSVTTRPRRAALLPLRTAVGLRAPPQASVFASVA